jgi:hypothetical protein
MEKQKITVGLNKGGGDPKHWDANGPGAIPTLADAGIDKVFAHVLIRGAVGICPDLASLRKFDSGISS